MVNGAEERKYLKNITSKQKPPYLLEIQKDAYEWFFREGLRELFDEINPVKDIIGRDFELYFLDYSLDEPKFDESTARFKNLTYETSLKVRCKLINKKTGEIKEQDVYLGDFPIMTENGTFIINGIERVVVSQLVRSPGVFFTTEVIRGRKYYGAKIIPNRGAWLEISTDQHNVIWVKIDRKRKVAVTSLLQAFGLDIPEIKEKFKDVDNDPDINYIETTLKKDLARTQDEALIEVYKRIRPGDLVTADNAKSLIFATFFNFERYDFSRVGRYKINNKFGFTYPNTPENRVLKIEDLIAIISEIISLNISQDEADDIDHLSNRRVRAVGELLQARLRVGLARMRRIIKDKMSTLNVDSITPVQLINSRPITSVIREFFMSSQLSQFMDQVNPLAELENKRRLSVMGPGGIQRERAGFEVRDVHRTHYGKICPIESPEGSSIGLVGHMALYARVNEYGFLETPYRRVYRILDKNSDLLIGKILNEDIKGIAKKGDKITKEMFKKMSAQDKVREIKIKPFVSDEVYYLTAAEEEKYVISINYSLIDGHYFKKDFVEARIHGEAGNASVGEVDYVDVAANQIVGVSAALIPFLEHTDAHRALMGSNMQRQAVPCINPESPIIGTGLEGIAAVDSGQVYVAPIDGQIIEADARHLKLLGKDKNIYSYNLRKFARSNQGTCINQKLRVNVGEKVKKGDVLVDGMSTDKGELALGQNLKVAFMCWEGGNYEDAVLLSERVVEADRYTSIHINTKVIEVRDTKIGPEIVTRDIPNISEDKLKNLDEDGIIIIGSEVGPGDILVGKITPKGETELSAEERLLRAIFGDKAKDVRDSSLRLEHGERGKVVDVKIFSREKGDKLQPGVIKSIEVSIATLRKVQVGDKMAGRYGNKGVISRIVKVEDMPYLEDGTPIDILLNPLGVVSRMNLGQIFEIHLGLAAEALGMKIASPVFNGVEKSDVADYLRKAGYSEDGKVQLYDGRTGEPFKEKTAVGVMYMMKLNHLVEDKIHQRSIGPYSLVTQQPLGGRAQSGGQRLGEMEVWTLEAYGAANILQEMLTIKSDDVIGRSKAYEAIIRGEPIQKVDIPESFNVLVREMRGLCLDVQLLKKDGNNYQDVSDLFFDDSKLIDTNNKRSLNFDGIKLSIASPEKIKSWSHGEVTKPETINYRTQKPERDGLLCERIFGPVKDWECACGKYRKIRYKGIVCDKCGVEVTKSIVRRSRFGHIDLCVPVSHIWYLKGIPSKIGLLLDLSSQALERVVYFADFIITNVNEELKNEALERLNNEYKGKKKALDNEMKQKISQVKNIAQKENKKIEDVVSIIEDDYGQQFDTLKQDFDDTRAELIDLKIKKIISEEKYRRLSIKFGYLFEAQIGAEAIRKLLSDIDLQKLYKELENQLSTVSQLNKKRVLNRMQLVDNLIRNNIRSEWMILTTIPVLPPSLRPIVQLDGGRFASSDLNDLYRRIINRNNRLKRLIAINAPEVICRNEKRMLQESVDALIDNGARKSKMATASTGQKRALKSIADSLKGKQGRFRQNLLGKRVDYSGRSVIVVGPKLKISQCGVPKVMALELFKPFVISELIRREYVYNIRAASRLIEQGTKEVWDILEEVASSSYVLLNRAPSLHRLSMQAFKPVLIDGKAIQLHPLVCEAFNADFDGDQMAVHLPLSDEAIYEASEIMLSKKNLLKPANGDPITLPRMDMILGSFYLTNIQNKEAYEKAEPKVFVNYDELLSAYNMGVITLQDKVSFKDESGKIITTIVGRVIINNILPRDMRNYEVAFDKKNIKKIIGACLEKYSFSENADLLDEFKDLTFEYVTKSGMSVSLGDLPDITEEKKEHVEKARIEVNKITEQYEMGFLTDQERHRKVIELWSRVKDEVSNIGEKRFNHLSPFYVMVQSGARGSTAQLNQMVSMKGTVISPSGEIIELPIRHSLQEGFDALEYFISTHGARKGLTDTALKTSSAGYLTRRLVDVSQDVIIAKDDCGDKDGVLITKEECDEIGESIETRIFGRYALEDIIDRSNNSIIVKKDEIISKQQAKQIAGNENINSVRVRSILSCKCDRGVCAKCYGYDLARNELVEVGTPIGIIAAQSIGEPATQLVLRTFHSGGISGSDITQGLPRVEEIFEARNVKKKAFLAEYDGKIEVEESDTKEKEKIITLAYKSKESEDYELLKGMDLVKNDGDKIKVGETIIKIKNKKINAKHKGIIKISQDKISILYEIEDKKEYIIPFGYNILVKAGDAVSRGDALTDGSIDLYELYNLKGQRAVQLYILKEIQHVYTSQGQDLNDKHIEIIIRQMFSKIRILNPGDSRFIRGDIVSLGKFNSINENLKKNGLKPAKGILLLLGITKVAEHSDSWLSAASFQETTRALVNASISGEIDELVGLKENVIIGRPIPVGTGLRPDLIKPIRRDFRNTQPININNSEIENSMESEF
ncbi:MAG TPA: DNA-directed RNA polymerase subunit beta' [bacterium]|nr:DNA-directed RNA polymerase subunit beta' [bacterium]